MLDKENTQESLISEGKQVSDAVETNNSNADKDNKAVQEQVSDAVETNNNSTDKTVTKNKNQKQPADKNVATDTQDYEMLYEQQKLAAEKNWDSLLRLRAEMDNLRKRSAKDVQNAHSYGLEKFINSLLPVIDSLDLAIQNQEGADNVDNMKAMYEGMSITQKMFIDVLANSNVERINPVGEKFDAKFHEALTMQVDESKPENTVLTVVQVGYSLNDRLLRAAKVIVSRLPQDG